MINIVEYLKIAIILVGIDSFYLSMISKFFNNQVRLIQGTPIDMRYSAAVLAYVFLTVGMYYYIIVKKISLLEAFGLGIFVYGVYETQMQLFLNVGNGIQFY